MDAMYARKIAYEVNAERYEKERKRVVDGITEMAKMGRYELFVEYLSPYMVLCLKNDLYDVTKVEGGPANKEGWFIRWGW